MTGCKSVAYLRGDGPALIEIKEYSYGLFMTKSPAMNERFVLTEGLCIITMAIFMPTEF